MQNIQSKFIYRCPFKICYQDQDKKCHLVSPKCPSISSCFSLILSSHIMIFHLYWENSLNLKKIKISGPECTKINDILDNAASKWVGYMAHILAYLFNSTSKQHHSLFPFLHSIKDSIPPSEACLYGCTSLSLVQVHHHSSLGLLQSSISIRVPQPGPGLGSTLMFKNGLCQSMVVPSCQGSPTFILGLIIIRVAGSPWEVHCPVPLTLGRSFP